MRALIAIVVGASLAQLAEAGAPSYVIPGFVVANGGTPSAGISGSGRVLHGTAGQAAVGMSGDVSHSLCHGFWCFGGVRVIAVDDGPPGASLPTVLAFARAFPNPAPGEVRFAVDLPRAARVDLRVFDVQGRVVRVIESGRLEPGFLTLTWDGRDGTGRPLGAGMYFARLVVEDRLVGHKKLIIRQ